MLIPASASDIEAALAGLVAARASLSFEEAQLRVKEFLPHHAPHQREALIAYFLRELIPEDLYRTGLQIHVGIIPREFVDL